MSKTYKAPTKVIGSPYYVTTMDSYLKQQAAAKAKGPEALANLKLRPEGFVQTIENAGRAQALGSLGAGYVPTNMTLAGTHLPAAYKAINLNDINSLSGVSAKQLREFKKNPAAFLKNESNVTIIYNGLSQSAAVQSQLGFDGQASDFTKPSVRSQQDQSKVAKYALQLVMNFSHWGVSPQVLEKLSSENDTNDEAFMKLRYGFDPVDKAGWAAAQTYFNNLVKYNQEVAGQKDLSGLQKTLQPTAQMSNALFTSTLTRNLKTYVKAELLMRRESPQAIAQNLVNVGISPVEIQQQVGGELKGVNWSTLHPTVKVQVSASEQQRAEAAIAAGKRLEQAQALAEKEASAAKVAALQKAADVGGNTFKTALINFQNNSLKQGVEPRVLGNILEGMGVKLNAANLQVINSDGGALLSGPAYTLAASQAAAASAKPSSENVTSTPGGTSPEISSSAAAGSSSAAATNPQPVKITNTASGGFKVTSRSIAADTAAGLKHPGAVTETEIAGMGSVVLAPPVAAYVYYLAKTKSFSDAFKMMKLLGSRYIKGQSLDTIMTKQEGALNKLFNKMNPGEAARIRKELQTIERQQKLNLKKAVAVSASEDTQGNIEMSVEPTDNPQAVSLNPQAGFEQNIDSADAKIQAPKSEGSATVESGSAKKGAIVEGGGDNSNLTDQVQPTTQIAEESNVEGANYGGTDAQDAPETPAQEAASDDAPKVPGGTDDPLADVPVVGD